jgi:hypothetical protein
MRHTVRPSACVNADPTGRISVKFGMEEFYENLPREPKYG